MQSKPTDYAIMHRSEYDLSKINVFTKLYCFCAYSLYINKTTTTFVVTCMGAHQPISLYASAVQSSDISSLPSFTHSTHFCITDVSQKFRGSHLVITVFCLTHRFQGRGNLKVLQDFPSKKLSIVIQLSFRIWRCGCSCGSMMSFNLFASIPLIQTSVSDIPKLSNIEITSNIR